MLGSTGNNEIEERTSALGGSIEFLSMRGYFRNDLLCSQFGVTAKNIDSDVVKSGMIKRTQ